MNRFILVGLFVLLFCAHVQAETMFVNDLMEITFRTGPGVDHKIVDMLKSGQTVETLQTDNDWTQVRLPSEREGWVLTRFISVAPPSSLIVKGLKERNSVLMRQAASLLEEKSKIFDENARLVEQLSAAKRAFSEISQAHETLKKESGEYFSLKQQYGKSVEELKKQMQQMDQLETALADLQLNHNIKWFLSGAGVLLFGILIGFSAKRQRRRSSLI
jgi:SH3 domain protein